MSCHSPAAPFRPGWCPKPSPLAGEGRVGGRWALKSEAYFNAYREFSPFRLQAAAGVVVPFL